MKLAAEIEQKIADAVESGPYRSADEVVAEALRLLELRDRQDADYLADIRIAAKRRFEQLDRGEGIDGDRFFDEMDRRLSRLEQA